MRRVPARRRVLVACVALAVAGAAGVLPGCAQKPAEDDSAFRPEPEPEPGDVSVVVTPAAASVALGDEIVLKVRVSLGASSAAPAHVNRPRLSEDSVTFRVRSDAFAASWVQRFAVKESPNGPAPLAAEAVQIAPGGAVEGEIRFPAVLPGKLVLTPVYRAQGLPGPVTAAPVTIDVTTSPGKERAAVRLKTSHGDLVAVLRPDLAFNTCTSFAGLAKAGFYDGLPFHRVVQGFMAQGGAPGGRGWDGPGFHLRRELHGKLPHARGVFAMARMQQPDTAGSQFYVCFGPQPALDQMGYTTFATLLDGEETLAKIERDGASPGGPTEAPRAAITILDAELVTVGR